MRTIAFWLLFISQGLFTLSAQSYTFSGINYKREAEDDGWGTGDIECGRLVIGHGFTDEKVIFV